MEDYDFLVINHHSKVLRRQMEKAILLDWAQGRGVLMLGKRIFKINK